MLEEGFAQMLMEYAGLTTSEEVEIQVICHLRAWKEGRASLVGAHMPYMCGPDGSLLGDLLTPNFLCVLITFAKRQIDPAAL